MSWMLVVVAVLLLVSVMYARQHAVELTGFGQRFLPRAKGFIDDLKEGAQGVGIAPCEACGYYGVDRRYRHVAGMYLCSDCNAYEGGKLVP